MVKPPSILDRNKKPKPKYNCCANPKPESVEDGGIVCMNCFAELVNAGNIVAEVTFSEDAGGRATAQGSYVQGGARHANTLGAGARRLGGSDREPGQNAAANASKILGGLCPRLNLSDTLKQQAVSLYSLASGQNFSAGRRTDEVVAACLYAVCRRQKDNQVLLIDISELQRINVFRLGEVYKSLCKEVFLDFDGKQSTEKAVGTQRRLEVESLIMKYCRKLEFGDKTRQVAEDAVRILRRMKRDWIVTGRHPAGLCGACIIYAARMNNFRRTKREVVYVAKIADQTVALRMKEFQQTRAASMSVEQFREKGEYIKQTHDPPAIGWSAYRRAKFEEKKRKRLGLPPSDSTANGGQTNPPPSEAAAATEVPEEDGEGPRKRQKTADGTPSTPPPSQQEPRFDADGFVVPHIPASLSRPGQQGSQHEMDAVEELAEAPQPKKRGRKPKELWVPSSEDLVAEADLEREIQEMLDKDEKDDSLKLAQMKLNEDKALERQEERERKEKGLPAQDQQKSTQDQQQRSRTVTFANGQSEATRQPEPEEEVTAEDLEAEFADDPEVLNCLLPEMERKVKEQIWVAENEDWMRVQVAKDIRKRLNQEHRKEKAGRKGTKGRRKKGRMGDGSTIAEATTPIETPLDANRAMFERRGMPKGISKHINYEALKKAYGRNPSVSSQSRDTSEAPTNSRAPSMAPSEATGESSSPTPNPHEEREQTPPAKQARGVAATSPTPANANEDDAPRSPLQTQTEEQATAGAEENQEDEEDDGEGDPNDYLQQEDELDYGSDDGGRGGWLGGGDDDREDIGEDEYGPLSRNALPQYGDDDDYE